MELKTAVREENILIVDEEFGALEEAHATLSSFFPDACVEKASSLEHLSTQLETKEFDIVVLDHDLSCSASMVELIYKLKTENYEPAVVITSRDPHVKDITELYKFGCHRCIVKDERWLEELGLAVDYLLRWRKAVNENLELRAKLTETNMLLQEKNIRLNDFSATLAHDIRGPLGGISMRLDYILDVYGQDIDDRFRELLERAYSSTERLTDLVQAMYEYAKLGSDAAEMSFVELNTLVDEVIHDLNVEESLDIHFHIDELPEVWGNRELLRRVFINLINNAIKYNDKERIVIELGLNTINQRVLASYSEIFVKDNGAGIEEKGLKEIFSMFSRGSLAEEYGEGSGIGLAVVKRIVDLHYGNIEVQSVPSEGTTFKLSLPMEKVDISES